MTTKATRKRSDSTQARVEAMQSAAAAAIEVPEGVFIYPEDAPFWKAVTEARPRSTWTTIDLMHAATLARTLRDMESYFEGEAELDVGTFDKLSRRAMSLSRMLHVHTLATVGRSGDAAGLAALERDARAQHHEDDGLIPKGPVQ